MHNGSCVHSCVRLLYIFVHNELRLLGVVIQFSMKVVESEHTHRFSLFLFPSHPLSATPRLTAPWTLQGMVYFEFSKKKIYEKQNWQILYIGEINFKIWRINFEKLTEYKQMKIEVRKKRRAFLFFSLFMFFFFFLCVNGMEWSTRRRVYLGVLCVSPEREEERLKRWGAISSHPLLSPLLYQGYKDRQWTGRWNGLRD